MTEPTTTPMSDADTIDVLITVMSSALEAISPQFPFSGNMLISALSTMVCRILVQAALDGDSKPDAVRILSARIIDYVESAVASRRAASTGALMPSSPGVTH